MENNFKRLLRYTSPEQTRQLFKKCVDAVQVHTKEKQVIIMVDKQHEFNQLCSGEHIPEIIVAVEIAFGEEYEVILKRIHYIIEDMEIHHYDTHRNTPFTVDYKERNIPQAI